MDDNVKTIATQVSSRIVNSVSRIRSDIFFNLGSSVSKFIPVQFGSDILHGLPDAVARAAQICNQLFIGMRRQLFAERADVHLDGIGKQVVVTRPYVLDELFGADGLAAV